MLRDYTNVAWLPISDSNTALQIQSLSSCRIDESGIWNPQRGSNARRLSVVDPGGLEPPLVQLRRLVPVL